MLDTIKSYPYRKYVAAAGVIALIGGPIPGTSLILTGLELVMIRDIARRYGESFGLGDISQFGSFLYSAGELLKMGAIEASTAVPFVGWWIAKPAIAISAVLAISRAADYYYSRDQAERGKMKDLMKSGKNVASKTAKRGEARQEARQEA